MTAQPMRDVVSGALPLQSRKAEIPLASVDVEGREFDIVISTGAKVRRHRWEGWGTRIAYDEELVISKDACNIERVDANAVMMLDSHSTWGGVTATFGKVSRAWIEGGKLMGRVKLHDAGVSEEADKLFGMIRGGTAPAVSAGYTVDAADVTQPEKRGEVELMRVTRWTLYEVSFVAMPADMGAGLRASEMTFPVTINRASSPQPEESLMDESKVKTSAGDEPVDIRTTPEGEQPAPEPVNQRQADDAPAHAWSSADIRKINERAKLWGLDGDHAIRAMEQTGDLSAATDFLQAEAARQARASGPAPAHTKVQILRDEGDTIRRAIGDAVVHRANPAAVKLDDAARQWRGMRLLEMGKTYIEETQGCRLRGLSTMELAGAVLGLTRAAGMQSTSDFALILANTANRRLQMAYDARPSAWRQFCRQSNVTDFKARFVNRLSEAPRLEKVGENGEFKYGKVTEQGESYALATYGKVIAFTRQSIINDDMAAFDRLPAMYGAAAADNEADVVWGIITANAAMSDGTALFHANHGNLGTGAALSVTSLSEARKNMRKQKNLQSKQIINVQASYLLVPAALETTAEQIIAQNMIPSQTSSVVPEWYRSLTPIVEPRLDDSSATAWYLAADPSQIDTIEYAYLDGQEGVYTETRVGFEVDGIEIKARHDFAAKAIDWRGLHKNAGA